MGLGEGLVGRHVVFLSWRDTANPEGGGAERYLEHMAAGLAERGCRVTVFSAAFPGAPLDETHGGVRFVRRGSKLTVYVRGLLMLLLRRFGRVDLVVDVQNGMPFLSRLVTRRPVVVLVHHVHREQWPVVYPGLVGRVGWWVEHWLAPRIYRSCQYVAVSRATREELSALGVDPGRMAVVHNGTEEPPPTSVAKAADPTLCTVGRLVPHKQVEHAVDVVVALREEFPRLRLLVAGDGWWREELHAYVARHGATGAVVFTGHVEEERKQEVFATSWLQVLPSLKEGWGIVVGEAAMHGTPTVAYRSAGGTRESIAQHVSGVLVDDADELLDAVRGLLRDDGRRLALAEGARQHARRYTWAQAQASFATVLASVLAGRLVSADDPPGAMGHRSAPHEAS